MSELKAEKKELLKGKHH